MAKGLGVTDPSLQDVMFNLFDEKKDGTIDFEEYLTALSVMKRGTVEERLECKSTIQPLLKRLFPIEILFVVCLFFLSEFLLWIIVHG